ncbi:uncharacterized protein RCC_03315 [Ramularia collo-cygni]|uniref:Uncharacterized protein n=1 Tax=Ramularia collo-cygni TaxID=112498 RepID=A0A2D3UPT0_9PEZI|nr:uncharacterized protein RCC_03315 [Ramularia collo-cygni]CZT17481.1 uncharacterized protein RCC_03315 [Ramularia collo-cygni]
MSTSASTSASSALFKRWTDNHDSLGGPTDFHTFQHYLDLYVLAKKSNIEELQNKVMDLIRNYYRAERMTAPAFRLEYIYTATHEPNAMKLFLLQSAAYRILCEQPDDSGHLISDSIRGTLSKNNEMAVDFAEAVIELSRNGLADPRHGSDCV